MDERSNVRRGARLYQTSISTPIGKMILVGNGASVLIADYADEWIKIQARITSYDARSVVEFQPLPWRVSDQM